MGRPLFSFTKPCYSDGPMTKSDVIQAIIASLKDEELRFKDIADKARASAIDTEIKQEAKYDTRSIEAGYLAGSLARRYEEIIVARQEMELFKPRSFLQDEAVAAGALLRTRNDAVEKYYLITPNTGGIHVRIENKDIHALSVESRMGQLLMGSLVGDCVEIPSPKGAREIEILEIF